MRSRHTAPPRAAPPAVAASAQRPARPGTGPEAQLARLAHLPGQDPTQEAGADPGPGPAWANPDRFDCHRLLSSLWAGRTPRRAAPHLSHHRTALPLTSRAAVLAGHFRVEAQRRAAIWICRVIEDAVGVERKVPAVPKREKNIYKYQKWLLLLEGVSFQRSASLLGLIEEISSFDVETMSKSRNPCRFDVVSVSDLSLVTEHIGMHARDV